MTDTTRESVERAIKRATDAARHLPLSQGIVSALCNKLRALLTRAEAAEAERDALEAKLGVAAAFIEDLEGCEWPINAQAKRILATLTADTPKEGKDDE